MHKYSLKCPIMFKYLILSAYTNYENNENTKYINSSTPNAAGLACKLNIILNSISIKNINITRQKTV